LELWIEGTIDEVAKATASGLAAGVATNPTIIARWTADGRSLEDVVTEACQRLTVPIYVQLHGPDVETYLREMEALLRISDQIHPKLVATHSGIEAAQRLGQWGRKSLVTAVASVNQAFLAAAAGASYIAPYYGRIEAAGIDAAGFVRDVANLYARHNQKTQIAAASLRSPEQVEAAILAGAHVAVMGYGVFQFLLDNDLTQAWIDGFEKDWSRFDFDSPNTPAREIASTEQQA
jgi:transaldolase